MIIIPPFLALLLILSFTGADSSLQPDQTSKNSRIQEIHTNLIEAKRLQRENPRKAIDLLNRLNLRYPENVEILVLLGHLYQTVGDADSAIAVFRVCLEKDRKNLVAGKALGMLYLSQGENDKANMLFDSLLKDRGYSADAYIMVGSAVSEVGMYDLALKILREGRDRSADHYKLALNIADLERTMGNYRTALKEYMNYVEHFPNNYKLVKMKILGLFEDAASARYSGDRVASMQRVDELLELAEESLLELTAGRMEILDILSIVYFRKGLFEKALDAVLEADQSMRSDGETLYSLAEGFKNKCFDKPPEKRLRFFDLCIRALDAYIERHPRTFHTPRVSYLRAVVLADAGSGFVPGITKEDRALMLEAALDALDRIFKKYPQSEEAGLAVLKKGDLIFEIQRQPREALAVYQEGLNLPRSDRGAFVEKIGRMYIVLGEYDLAQRHFAQYIRSTNEELRGTGIYYTGVLMSFTGRYEAAKDTLTFLAEENPASLYTNDAIELAWIVEEGRQKDEEMLAAFIESLKAEIALDTAAVVENLERIASRGPGTALHQRALYRLGGVYAQMGKYELALDRFQSFIDEYPDDDLRPDVHRAIARVYEFGYGKLDLALEEYENILVRYPNYIFLDEVRDDINRLRPKEKGN